MSRPRALTWWRVMWWASADPRADLLVREFRRVARARRFYRALLATGASASLMHHRSPSGRHGAPFRWRLWSTTLVPGRGKD